MIKGDFITDASVIEDDYYLRVKEIIKCNLCNKIFKDPVLCKNCQKTYCKVCIENWIKTEGTCPNCEKESEYPENIDKSALLFSLKFLCKNCKEEIKYNDVESHLQIGCITNKNSSNLFDAIYKKKKLIKLSPEEVNKIKKNKQYINHLSSKKK